MSTFLVVLRYFGAGLIMDNQMIRKMGPVVYWWRLREANTTIMAAAVYDDVEIEDMEFDEEEQVYSYPCPCGDRFSIDLEDLYAGEDIATCPSCSLTIRVVFKLETLPDVVLDDKNDTITE